MTSLATFFYFLKKLLSLSKNLYCELYFLFFVFIFLIYCFVISDFYIALFIKTTTKPLIYKIVFWGNHEGSMLLFICIIALYGCIFCYFSKNFDNKFKYLTVFFQIINDDILIYLFSYQILLIMFRSPRPRVKLNPILQDPLLYTLHFCILVI